MIRVRPRSSERRTSGVAVIAVFLLGALAAVVGGLPIQAEERPAWAPMQERLIAQLSGWNAVSGQHVPFARSTPGERGAAAALLVDSVKELGFEPRLHDYRMPNANGLIDLLLTPYSGSNVYFELSPADPESPYVIVGAHYDSEAGSPGAVDNASGVALVLAVAQEIAALDSRTLGFVFVLFDQEEDDEAGSRAFVRKIDRAGTPIHSAHIVDLAGWDTDHDGVIEIQSPSASVAPFYAAAGEALSIPLQETSGVSSDNRSFVAAGIPSVGVFDYDVTPHLHLPSDTYATVDFDHLTSTTLFVAAVLKRLAQQPLAPPAAQ